MLNQTLNVKKITFSLMIKPPLVSLFNSDLKTFSLYDF